MKVSKKLLSVLLAVIMIMSSVSVCFGTVSFAAGGTATEAQWNALVDALKFESVKNANFSGTTNNFTVDDPDGKVLAAVEAYWSVFSTLANKTPATGNPNNTTNSTGSGESNRTINQVNDTIKSNLSSRMGSDYATYNVATFITKLMAGASVSAGTGSKRAVGPSSSNDKTALATDLGAVADVNLTVVSEGAVTGYTLADLPAEVVTSKTFTVKHTNSNYDYTYATEVRQETQGSGCDATTVNVTYYTRTYAYFYNISAVSTKDGTSVNTQVIKDTAATLEANKDYFSKTMDELVYNYSASALTAVSNAVSTAKKNVVDSFSAGVFTHFFSDYRVDTLVSDIAVAKEIQTVEPYANDLMDKVAAGYNDIIENKDALNTLLSGIDTDLAVYNAASPSAKAFITGKGYDAAKVTALRNGVVRAIELIELRELLNTVIAEMSIYSQYDEEGIDEGDVTGADITAAVSKLQSRQTQLSAYQVADIDEITGTANFLGTITDLKNQLAYLGTIAEYNEAFADKYATFANDIFSITDADGDLTVLRDALINYDSWYTGLKALIDEMRTELGDELADMLFDDLNDVMVARMEDAYLALNTRIEGLINAAYDLFTAYVNTHGEKVIMATVSEYRAMKNSIGLIDVDAYNFLKSTANFDISDEAVAKYEAMQKDFPQYEQFLASHGFSTFETNEIKDLERPDTDKDIARENENGVYKATDAKVEEIISLLDAALNNAEVKKLLGDLINKDEETGEPTGEPFAIGALIENLLNESVFTDSLINTIMQFVYPLVAKEFAKVWAGLPATMTIEDVDTGMLGLKADVTAGLSLDDVETAIASVGVFLAPSTLAKNLQNAYGKNNGEYAKYTDAISVLQSATTKAVYSLNGEGDEDDTFVNPWEDPNLFENVYDEVTGEQVFNDDGTPKQVYKINWGVDEAKDKRAAFIDAACAALSGLEPLLFGILTNRTQANANDSDAVPRGSKIGTGSGSAAVFGIPLNLVIDPITLVLKFGGNDGYDNALAPIFEALGLTNIPHGEDLTTTRKILEDGLFAMIDQLIAKLDEAPVTFLLEALPNLAFALEGGLVAPLLGMLRTEISYYADAKYQVIGIINGNMPDAMKSEEPIIVDLGEMINLEDMGLDISSFQAIWNMIAGGVELLSGMAAPNAGYIATLGKLVEKNTNRSAKTYAGGTAGKAYHIEANKADVLIYLIKYVLGSGLIEGLLTEPNELIDGILKNVNENPDVVLAAIIELLTFEEYDTLKDYTWFEGTVNEDGTAFLTPAMIEYLAYDNDWTKEKATYILENVEELITAVMAMVGGENAEPFDLAATLEGLLGDLFTNANITKLAQLLSKLDINALLAGDETEEAPEAGEETIPDENAPETAAEGEEDTEEAASIDVAALVKTFVGLDFSEFANYVDLADDTTWGFEDGDAEGFVNALVAILEPLKPVLDFILAGNDISVSLSEDDKITLIGYNGYDNAIAPLLEALGCDVAALKADDNALALILNALVAKINAVIANPVDEILNLLPGVIYFIQSNGLATAVRNLLHPVYIILDTIRPIYDLDIAALLADIEINGQPLSINLDDLSWNFIINDLLPNFIKLDLGSLSTVIADVCIAIGEEYTSVSSFVGTGKKGVYKDNFDAADLLTVILTFALTWIQEGNNANDVVALIAGDDAEKAAEIQKYITGAITIIAGIEPQYQQINWAYNFPEGFDDTIYSAGITIQPTINALEHPNNWTEETAVYVAENLSDIVDEVIGMIDENYASLADFIADKLVIYSSDNVKAIVDLVAGLLEDINEKLLETVGVVLDVDILAIKNYEVPADIDTAEEFTAALTDVLSNIQTVVDWLFFGKDYAFFNYADGSDIITIKGTEGYGYGLAPILEALGVAAPAKKDATIENVLTAVFARVDEILENPVDEVFDMLPNIIYFLNANGVSVSVQNLLAGIVALTDTISEEFEIDLDLMGIFNDLINGILPEDSTVTLDVADLNLESIFTLVEELLGLDLAPVADIFVNLCVGKIEAYTSASGEYAFRMVYTDDFARYDMITILATVLFRTIKLDSNKDKLAELLGEDIVEAIHNLFGMVSVPVEDMDWILTDKADTGESLTAIDTSELYEGWDYGTLYTEEMAQYIADNFGSFVDNIIYLVGIEINGEGAESLEEIIDLLLGGSVYTKGNLEAIRDALKSLYGLIEGATGTELAIHLNEILVRALGVDLSYWNNYEVGEVTDRDTFVAELLELVRPFYPVLKWLLANDDIAFFLNEDDTDLITLLGADGYAYGIIPILEALDCEGVLTTEEYYAAAEADESALLTAILNPLLDKVDSILEAESAADEILKILPGVIYFINSNGLDTCVKNILNAVYTVLDAIEPIIGEFNLYDLIGLDLENLTFEEIFDLVIELIGNATGYTLDTFSADSVAELTVGQVVSFTSANGEKAYTMEYAEGESGSAGDMVTVTLRLALSFLACKENQEKVLAILVEQFNMDAAAQEYLAGVFEAIADCEIGTALGMDKACAMVYYLFYGVDIGADFAATGIKDLNKEWQNILAELGKTELGTEPTVGNLVSRFLDVTMKDILEDILDSDGVATNGFLKFFQKIIDWFKAIFEKLGNLFG